jgi:hypothetical protein
MNRNLAKELALNVSLEDLKQMFVMAKDKISDWTKVSDVNKGMSKGTAFNILSAGINNYKSINEIHNLAKTNMIREFGEFLPNIPKKENRDKQIVNLRI